MKGIFRILTYILIGAFCMGVTSCAGCAHRHRKKRERAEYSAQERRERRSDRVSRSGKGDRDYNYTALSSDNISQIAAGTDYDEMIECLYSQLGEIRSLRKEYFRGNMSDKEVETRMNEIMEKYRPVSEALEKASGEGALNYNQHKKQMKLLGEYMDELNSIGNKLGSDLDQILDH
ncbi:MAG: hypothetical protein K2H96_11155 [Muribaculaceae bacterium]|nr:hypothetical protein [Muribaculaceae bacterium]MDE6028566.1 hypothetical protein [Muribaculaceae bacterium]